MMVGGRGAQVLVDLLIFLSDIIGLNDIFRLIDFEWSWVLTILAAHELKYRYEVNQTFLFNHKKLILSFGSCHSTTGCSKI